MSISPATLTLDTALAFPSLPPSSTETCSICQELVSAPAPSYGTRYADCTPAEATAHHATESKAAMIKVCGPKHFFHTVCIMSWWTSGVDVINTCPLDRCVAFGAERVEQRPTENEEEYEEEYLEEDDEEVERELLAEFEEGFERDVQLSAAGRQLAYEFSLEYPNPEVTANAFQPAPISVLLARARQAVAPFVGRSPSETDAEGETDDEA
ncbi:hypothetical protein GMOD_00006099 [Pyrenophora seminiperda CCB06]|uniref:RING-type domain-containing protein n=1 Tax=Pyrenophora seminiperda CCB06 TaxID=1302712 RepID=A0A3M7M478_9PLEO|nr:hypothetical protein GMOD_00006099 [Pyrenophora seminiperda CCB06]